MQLKKQLTSIIRYLVIAVITSVVITTGSAVMFGTAEARLQAYRAVETFLPWNIAFAYYDILTMPSDDDAQFPSLRPFETDLQTSPIDKRPTSNFSLTRDTPWVFRPLPALLDLIVHAFGDSGPLGLLFTLAQIAIAVGLVLYLGRTQSHGFYYYAIVVPLLVIGAAVVVAIPLWIIAYLAKLAGNTVALTAHSTATMFCLCWVRDRLVERPVHDTVEKTLNHVVDRAKDILR